MKVFSVEMVNVQFMGMSFTIAEMDLKPTLALVSTADTV